MQPWISHIDTRRQSLLHEWAWALSEDVHLSLADNLLKEVCDYFGVTLDEAVRRGQGGDQALKTEWLTQDPHTPAQIRNFYKSSDTYIYELMYWHSCLSDTRPLLYVPAIRLAHAAGALNYLDFGSGVGSQALLFAKHGMFVTMADIAPQMLDFCRWRFMRRDLNAQFIDLNTTALPENTFDFITAMEVLEHVPDPLETVRILARSLKMGGMMYFSAPFHQDELRPMHIVTDPHALWSIRSLGLEPVHVQLPDPTFHVYRRVHRPDAVNKLLARADRLTQNQYIDVALRLRSRIRNKCIYELRQLKQRRNDRLS